jgi:hypothetical protein
MSEANHAAVPDVEPVVGVTKAAVPDLEPVVGVTKAAVPDVEPVIGVTKAAVLAKYRDHYPKWTNVKVKAVIDDTFQGVLAVVGAVDGSGRKVDDEICFVSDEKVVRIFESTVELANFLSDRSKQTIFGWLRTRSGFSTILIILLLAVFIVLFVVAKELRPSILNAFTLAFGAAVASIFGPSNPGPKSLQD